MQCPVMHSIGTLKFIETLKKLHFNFPILQQSNLYMHTCIPVQNICESAYQYHSYVP